MGPCDDVHRVELQASDVADETQHAGLVGHRPGARKALAGDGQPPGLGLREAH